MVMALADAQALLCVGFGFNDATGGMCAASSRHARDRVTPEPTPTLNNCLANTSRGAVFKDVTGRFVMEQGLLQSPGPLCSWMNF